MCSSCEDMAIGSFFHEELSKVDLAVEDSVKSGIR